MIKTPSGQVAYSPLNYPNGFTLLGKNFLSGIGFIQVTTSHLAHFLTWNCLK